MHKALKLFQLSTVDASVNAYLVMKLNLLSGIAIVLSTVAIFAGGCGKDAVDDDADLTPGKLKVVAVTETRVQLNAELSTVWTEGDRVSVFNTDGGNGCWVFDGRTGDTHGTISLVSSASGTLSLPYRAVLYPYDASASISAEGVIATQFPTVQKYLPGSYGVGSNILLATGNEDELYMYNLCSYLNFRLTGTKCVKSVTVRGNNHDVLSGAAAIDCNSYAVALTQTSGDDGDDIKKAVLDCGDGAQLSEGDTTSFFIAIVPHTFELGLTAEIAYTDGTVMTKCINECIAMDRSRIYSFTDVTGRSTDMEVIQVEPYLGETADDAALDVPGTDEDLYWEANTYKNTVTVVYSGETAVVTTTNGKILCQQTGAHVTVDMLTNSVKETEIILKGRSEAGSLKVYGGKKYKLTLAGVDLTSDRGPAINSQVSKRTFVHLMPGTTNRIADASKYLDDCYYIAGESSDTEDRKGCFFAEGALYFSGSGVLVVKGNLKHGIAVDDLISTRPGVTVVVTDAKSNGIKAKGDDEQCVVMGGGLIYANVSATAGKCISCDGNFDMSGGKLVLGTTGGGEYDSKEKDATAASCIKVDSTFTITGGSIIAKSTGAGGKGISVDGKSFVKGGAIDITTSGGKYYYSRNITCSPKGFKSDGDLEISGGRINVNVTGNSDGSEGIEGKANVTINGGETFIYAYDDALNAANEIVINGGRLYCYAANNDGIDTNGSLTINGGIVISSGSSAPEEAFDCDVSSKFKVCGGTLIGISGASVSPNTSTTTQRTVIYSGLKFSKNDLISVCRDGVPVFSFTMPRTMNSITAFLSCADFNNGGSYSLIKGAKLSGYTDSWQGWYNGGTISGGTSAGTFTPSSMVTLIGNSGGGPGGGGFGPGRR